MVFVRLAMCAGLHCSLRAKAGTRAIMRTHLAPTMGTEWGLTSRTHSFACSSDFASFQGCATSACNATATRTDGVTTFGNICVWALVHLLQTGVTMWIPVWRRGEAVESQSRRGSFILLGLSWALGAFRDFLKL